MHVQGIVFHIQGGSTRACVCVRACVRACVSACVRACVYVRERGVGGREEGRERERFLIKTRSGSNTLCEAYEVCDG